ncbi:MAG TPA: TlpA disulfide reductase family protein [Vicinamibacterales bacterium]|nr:TlpA disulfide reductase family protein [Vicinamibacterales bacterium]
MAEATDPVRKSSMGPRWAAAAAVAVGLGMWPLWAIHDESPDGTVRANLEFTLPDMNGADVRLADFRGRPIILNFWATWCGPCREEIPALVAIADEYKAQRLAVLGVSVDDAPADLRRFAADYAMNYPVLVGLGQDALQETYDAAMFVPITWLIRADGTVFLKHQGPATPEWLRTQARALVAGASEPE